MLVRVAMYYSYFDPTYILVIIGVIIALFAQILVKSRFEKYSKVASMRNVSANMVATNILHMSGIYDVRIERVAGNLTDHYDPRSKVLRLSDSTYNSTSVAAIGVAAHECGHAIQHARAYAPLKLRSVMVPTVNIGSRLSWILIVIGCIFANEMSSVFISLGIICFSLVVLFSLVTLPVEFDASNRAICILSSTGILYDEEIKGAKKVLSAAAMTYVASAAVAILQLLRLIIRFGGRRRD